MNLPLKHLPRHTNNPNLIHGSQPHFAEGVPVIGEVELKNFGDVLVTALVRFGTTTTRIFQRMTRRHARLANLTLD